MTALSIPPIGAAPTILCYTDGQHLIIEEAAGFMEKNDEKKDHYVDAGRAESEIYEGDR